MGATLKLDLRGFNELITKLDSMVDDVRPAVSEAMEQAATKIARDTAAAVQKAELPAHGKYSHGETAKAIVQGAKTEWSGTTAEINVGFDYDEPGAGGYLITGTPRMKPAKKLHDMYKGRKYMKDVEAEMAEAIQKAIDDAMR